MRFISLSVLSSSSIELLGQKKETKETNLVPSVDFILGETKISLSEFESFLSV